MAKKRRSTMRELCNKHPAPFRLPSSNKRNPAEVLATASREPASNNNFDCAMIALHASAAAARERAEARPPRPRLVCAALRRHVPLTPCFMALCRHAYRSCRLSDQCMCAQLRELSATLVHVRAASANVLTCAYARNCANLALRYEKSSLTGTPYATPDSTNTRPNARTI